MTTVPETADGLDRGSVELDARHVAPQLFEPVVLARLGRENVEDDVDVVGHDPAALGLAGDRRRERALVVLQALVHLVPDRLRLARVLPGREHEEVRVGTHGAHVENEDVLCQLLLSEAGDSASVFEWRQWLFRSFRLWKECSRDTGQAPGSPFPRPPGPILRRFRRALCAPAPRSRTRPESRARTRRRGRRSARDRAAGSPSAYQRRAAPSGEPPPGPST